MIAKDGSSDIPNRLACLDIAFLSCRKAAWRNKMNRPLAFIVEDDPNLSEIFAEALTEAGFRVEVIARGDKALDRLAETVPEVVTLDMHLPRVSGDKILHYIRSDPRLAKTRVVIASADNSMTQTLEAEADLTLLKPVDFIQLRDLAQRLLSEDLHGH